MQETVEHNLVVAKEVWGSLLNSEGEPPIAFSTSGGIVSGHKTKRPLGSIITVLPGFT